MKHIEVYTRLKVILSLLPVTTDEDKINVNYVLKHAFKVLTKKSAEAQHIQNALNDKYSPTKGEYIKALSDLGFSNQHIASILDLTTNAVSFHKKASNTKPYRNVVWANNYARKGYLPRHGEIPESDYIFNYQYNNQQSEIK